MNKYSRQTASNIPRASWAKKQRGELIMKKDKKDIKKVVLAYSGGLDTSIIIPWLKENYNNCEVVAVSGDVGQGTELDGLEEKAIKTGASKLYVLDLKKDYVENYIWPCLKPTPSMRTTCWAPPTRVPASPPRWPRSPRRRTPTHLPRCTGKATTRSA